MKLTPESFEIAACNSKKWSWSDEELKELIEVYRCLVAFFKLRQEEMITTILRQELTSFEDFLQRRA